MHRFVAVIALLIAPGIAAAGVEIGGTAGLHVFNKDNGLGETMATNSAPLSNSALFGARLGIFFGDMIGVEAEGGYTPGEVQTGNLRFDVVVLQYRAHLAVQLRAGDPDNRLLPFFVAGAGAIEAYDSKNEDVFKKQRIIVPHAGAGLKWRTGSNWGMRLDLRVLLPVGRGDGAPDEKSSGRTQDLEALLSIYRGFGGPKKSVKIETPPPKEVDLDNDGIVGAADKCEKDPEDKDSFEDEDGCPDLDNDGDGIGDDKDKCIGEPEDKDSFEDEDGCPDPDNDGDGVPDAADKCVDKPETKNGFQDDDGCEDEIPEKLKQFTGVIQGITFKVNSVELIGGSNKTLDKAAEVLAEFKDTKLEIQGHTDDQPIGKGAKFSDNMALSQSRAEAVKEYFVKKGIEEGRLVAKGYGDSQPVTDPAGLKGPKLNAARAKNRRVEFKLITAEEAAPPAEKKPEGEPEKKPE